MNARSLSVDLRMRALCFVAVKVALKQNS